MVYCALITKVNTQKWDIFIKIGIHDEYTFESIALLDSSPDQKCTKEGLIRTKIF